MSGIVGIFNRDGAPVDRELLQRMTALLKHRGPDGINHWIRGSVGLGFLKLCSTPEAEREKQPLYDAENQLCLTFDGRIDNRRELQEKLSSSGSHSNDDTDAELVLQAFRYWGPSCCEKVLGDFAFAAWNVRSQTLTCARDILGLRPFYYFSNHRVFAWASELRPLLELPALVHLPNEGMIGEYLAADIVSKTETLFKGIYRLPPAHFMQIDSSSCQIHCYWTLDSSIQIRYKSDDEYAEHFLDIFKEAISCRLRSNTRVGVHLSGGIDSSSVASMAKILQLPNTETEAFSLVFPGMRCDESRYIQAVEEFHSLKVNKYQPKPHSLAWYENQARRYFDLPDYPNGSMSDPIRQAVKEKGIRVLLTGLGGDEWFRSTHYYYVDLVRSMRFLEIFQRMRTEASIPTTKTMTLRQIMRLLVSPRMTAALRRLRGRTIVPAWINREFAERISLEDRLRRDINWGGFSSFSQGFLFTASTDNWYAIHPTEMEERAAAQYAHELRHPLHDRRLLEFGLSIPDMQRRHTDQEKYVIRNAMKGILPEVVRGRLSKGEFTPVFQQAVSEIGETKFFDFLTELANHRNWLNEQKIQDMYQQFETTGTHIWPIWVTIGMGIWIQVLSGRS